MAHELDENSHILVFGPGYTAGAFARRMAHEKWRVSATVRDPEKAEELKSDGVHPIDFENAAAAIRSATHILVSVPPKEGEDPVLARYKSEIQAAQNLKWIGYLSSTNAYGDHGGSWVDETAESKPSLKRGQWRLVAEQAWQVIADQTDANLHIFRLAGIYGPGRNSLKSMKEGRARIIIKEGQIFSRIHRDDIVSALALAIKASCGNQIFNLADDMPSPPQDVVTYAAELLDMKAPAPTPIDDPSVSPMARSFYAESKRVRNDKIKDMLGVALAYPDYKTSLKKMLEDGTAY